MHLCFGEANFTTPWLGISEEWRNWWRKKCSWRESAMIKLSNSLLQKAKKTAIKKKTERRIPFPNEKKHRRGKVRWRKMCMLRSVSRRRHLNTQAKLQSCVWVSTCARARVFVSTEWVNSFGGNKHKIERLLRHRLCTLYIYDGDAGNRILDGQAVLLLRFFLHPKKISSACLNYSTTVRYSVTENS